MNQSTLLSIKKEATYDTQMNLKDIMLSEKARYERKCTE